ncbi:hypothetical protein [Glutamicibacter ardleyensis]|uniref:hypothetical protein n=1 Tax=Glutamicibacter ardleyensis TaxID=225894 RepID=UPI003F926044
MKKYARWKVLNYHWDSLQHFTSKWDRLPGIHTIEFGEGENTLDLYFNERVSEDALQVLPVVFSGAVSNRNGVPGPFFSGLGMTERAGLPLLSVADPTLDTDSSLTLGWYRGGLQGNVQENLIKTLNVVQTLLNCELLLVGGSGGGFAALSVAGYLSKQCSVLVWNPQTDIFQYSERFIKAYLRSQFSFSHDTLRRPDWREYCFQRTSKQIKTDVVNEGTIRAPRRLVYLQNRTDSHKDIHLAPLWKKTTDSPLRNGQNKVDDNRVVYIADFAEGHQPPSNILIGEIIEELCNPDSISSKLKSLSNFA